MYERKAYSLKANWVIAAEYLAYNLLLNISGYSKGRVRERSQIHSSRPSRCCSRLEGLGKHVAVRHKRANGTGTIQPSHRSLHLTSHSTVQLATEVASQLQPQACVMPDKVVSTFLPDVQSPSGSQNYGGQSHSVSDV